MHTKKRKYTDNISVAFDKDLKNKIIELATGANISQGEFVRDAVEHYISYLKDETEITETNTNLNILIDYLRDNDLDTKDLSVIEAIKYLIEKW